MNDTSGAVRGFFIALAISVGVPLAMIPLSLVIPGFAVLFAYVIAPQQAFVYPAFLFSAIQAQAPLLSLIQMLVFSVVFGWVTRARSGGSQFRWAALVLAAWWVAWRLVGLAFGLHANFDVRM